MELSLYGVSICGSRKDDDDDDDDYVGGQCGAC